ncbi:MAG: hypothetical protein ACLQLH_01620 [Terracidiphilus sp.]
MISRRPDAITHAQFWAEDGHAWFADAYNFGGWAALLRTQDGYFQGLPRLTAALAALVPLRVAPLVFNLIAIAIEALPVNLLLSFRSSAWGSLRYRALLAFVYLALPNCWEMGAIITNSQWLLALCAFLLSVATAPRSIAGRAFDIAILLLCGLTGPFCLFLVLIAFFLAWKHRENWRWIEAGILAACCLIQACGLLIVDSAGRSHYAVLGASPALFVRLLAAQVYLATLIGGNGLAYYSNTLLFIFLLCVAIGGTALVVYCFIESTVEMRLFLAITALLFAASLSHPSTASPKDLTGWELLTSAGGIRYWFFPTLAFAWSILWCFHSRIRLLRIVSAPLILLMCIGIIRDWRHPAFEDMHFAEHVQRFEAAPAGTVLNIPENPAGWTVRLVKRPAGR